MNTEEIQHRFEYHPPKDDKTREAHEFIRASLRVVANSLNELLPESREKSLALTHLEEAMFWANAAIARNQ